MHNLLRQLDLQHQKASFLMGRTRDSVVELNPQPELQIALTANRVTVHKSIHLARLRGSKVTDKSLSIRLPWRRIQIARSIDKVR